MSSISQLIHCIFLDIAVGNSKLEIILCSTHNQNSQSRVIVLLSAFSIFCLLRQDFYSKVLIYYFGVISYLFTPKSNQKCHVFPGISYFILANNKVIEYFVIDELVSENTIRYYTGIFTLYMNLIYNAFSGTQS